MSFFIRSLMRLAFVSELSLARPSIPSYSTAMLNFKCLLCKRTTELLHKVASIAITVFLQE